MTWLDQLLMDDSVIFLLAKSSSEIADLSGLEDANIRLMSILTGCFFLAVGASIGSFLNVVVYRWPRQMSLSDPPSMCPQCRTPIERRDNIPVIGWLMLRGRCRACRAPIPIRYPAVELAVGVLFVGLLFVELLSGGANLPNIAHYSYAGIVWILWYTKWDLVGLYLFHLLLLTALGALALMHSDGFAIHWLPWKTSLSARVAGLALLLLIVLPHLHPVPFVSPLPSWLERCQWMVPVRESFLSNRSWSLGVSLPGLFSGLLGGSAGFLCGSIVQGLFMFHMAGDQSHGGLTVMLSLCGLFLGWQAVVCITAGTVALVAILWAMTRITSVAPISSSEIVWLVTLSFLLSWRSTHAVWEQAGSSLVNQIGF